MSVIAGRSGNVTQDAVMNQPKVEPEDYIQFLVASPRQYTCTEAAAVQPAQTNPPAHDAFRRLLTRLEPDPDTLWQEALTQIRPREGVWFCPRPIRPRVARPPAGSDARRAAAPW